MALPGCGNAVDKAVKGQCLKYYGLRLTCGDKQYFRCDIVGKERWLEAHDLELSGASKCRYDKRLPHIFKKKDNVFVCYLFVVFINILANIALPVLSDTHNILGANPDAGACFCATTGAAVYDNACGKSVSTVKSGTCMKYWGLRLTCGESQYFAVSYQGKKRWIDGKAFASQTAHHCSIGSGLGTVDFRGKHVSDAIVKQKLHEIADYFGTRLWVTSGDRNGNGHSHHDVGRAADFWLDGWDSGKAIFDRLRSSGILDTDFQVIWHGSMTCTSGEHIHIGRYGDGRRTCWVNEGISRSSVCVYNCM
ncbi:uncharacterized protein LOC135473359 [Liolophura sinensis]|uniref:uncharacterized protein LOC135473359 n=1 Tax=Liolophura sinensis TaxID=3198878 RepID=UPI003158B29B